MDYQLQNYSSSNTHRIFSETMAFSQPIFNQGTSLNFLTPTAVWLTHPVTYLVPNLPLTPLPTSPYSGSLSPQESHPDWKGFNGDTVCYPYMGSNSPSTPVVGSQERTQNEDRSDTVIKVEEHEANFETSKKVNELAVIVKKQEEKDEEKEIQKKEKGEINVRNLKPAKKMKRKPIDKDYLPHRSEKKEARRRLHQNENRNVIPNEINQILSFLQKRSKSEHILARIWAKNPARVEKYSIGRFYLYQNVLKEKTGHYSNEQQLRLLGSLYEPQCRIWSFQQQRHYIKLARMLVGHFLNQDCIPIILTSKRMQSAKKSEHLRMRREVARRVKGLMGERRSEIMS